MGVATAKKDRKPNPLHSPCRTREQVIADMRPLPPPIEGLTDEERDAFLAAIAEA